MSEGVAVALLSLFGTLVGSFAGIVTANRLVNYRLQELEKKVDKHNNEVERTYRLEGRMDTVEETMRIYHEGNSST